MFEDADDLAAFFDAEDGFAVMATYRAGGTGGGTGIPVLPTRPDRSASLFGQPSAHPSGGFLIRVSDAPALASGDTLVIAGVTYTVQGVPLRDDTRAIWTVEAREG